MGVILEKPIVEKEVYNFAQGQFRGSVVAMQGWRTSMEVGYGLGCNNGKDAHIVKPAMDFDETTGFFGIFDGHGGSEVSEYWWVVCRSNQSLVEKISFRI